MAGLPKQVEQDLQELAEYEKQLAAAQGGAQPEDPKPADPVVTAPEAKPADPKAPVVAAPEVKPDVPNWEQKYRTLQGMFDKQVPELHAQNKALAAQIQEMQAQITALAQPKPAEKTKEPLVTDADVTEFGAPLLDVQRRVATEIAQSVVAPLQEELDKRNKEIAELKTAQTKTDGDLTTLSFAQQLARDIPDFDTINADPKWIAWLDEVDPLTTEPRRTYAEFVYNNGHVAKLKAVVALYKSTAGAATPEATQAAELQQQRQTELERQITPTRANSQNTTEVPADSKVYTEADATAGFNRVRILNTAGKYEEANKLEAELTRAYMEGRVRG